MGLSACHTVLEAYRDPLGVVERMEAAEVEAIRGVVAEIADADGATDDAPMPPWPKKPKRRKVYAGCVRRGVMTERGGASVW